MLVGACAFSNVNNDAYVYSGENEESEEQCHVYIMFYVESGHTTHDALLCDANEYRKLEEEIPAVGLERPSQGPPIDDDFRAFLAFVLLFMAVVIAVLSLTVAIYIRVTRCGRRRLTFIELND